MRRDGFSAFFQKCWLVGRVYDMILGISCVYCSDVVEAVINKCVS